MSIDNSMKTNDSVNEVLPRKITDLRMKRKCYKGGGIEGWAPCCGQCPQMKILLSYVCRILCPLTDAFQNVNIIYAAAVTFGVSTANCEASFSYAHACSNAILTINHALLQSKPGATQLSVALYTRCLDLDKFVNSFAQKSRKLQL